MEFSIISFLPDIAILAMAVICLGYGFSAKTGKRNSNNREAKGADYATDSLPVGCETNFESLCSGAGALYVVTLDFTGQEPQIGASLPL